MWFIQLAVLLLVFSLLRSFVPISAKIVSVLISILFGILFTIQFSSVLLTGEIANYRFYENFNIGDVLSVAGFFGKEGLLIAVMLILSSIVIYFLGGYLSRKINRKVMTLFPLLVGLVVLSTSGGIINNAVNTLDLKFAGDTSFDEALSALEIDADLYTRKDEIKASKGKNIIVLSLESLEKGYLGPKLNHLTPNLSRMAKEHTLFPMKQNTGSSWTVGSMYTALTGMPAYFGNHGNKVFQNSYENKLTTLADVLLNAGYDLEYFIGKKEYTGIDDMLTSLGFTVKSEKDFETKYQTVDWGIQDLDLFGEFKKELKSRKNSNRPFALFLSTIGTHFPNGVPDSRIDSLLPPQKSRLELMVSATDYLVGDLIDFLKKENMWANTVFYIYPDHLLMGKKSRVVADFDERSLYVMTNADTNNISYSPRTIVSQIDVPKIILEGAEIEHNAKFLTDFIAEDNKNAFIAKNDKKLLQLNSAALKSHTFKDGIHIAFSEGSGDYTLRNQENTTSLTKATPKKGFCHRILFDADFRNFDVVNMPLSQVSRRPDAYAYLDIFKSNGFLYASLKGGHQFGITKNTKDAIVFDTDDLAILKGIELNTKLSDFIELSSNSWDAKQSSFFEIKGKTEGITRGLTVIVFNKISGFESSTFDTHGSLEETEAFIAVLEKLRTSKAQFIILAHDSAAKTLQSFSDTLQELGFKKLSDLDDREAYIMHNLSGEIVEMVDNLSLNLQLEYPKKINNDRLYFTTPKPEFSPAIDRYIAHAGGEIDGIKYTNSKEALDHSYRQGFRLFELDIIETSNGDFVAAHDWGHWAQITKYSDSTPVSAQTFLDQKLHGKYTPMDMRAINQWFKTHPDAILVTDKVDKPAEFAEAFVDKNRLMMELFTLRAVEEAGKIGVSALISERPLTQIQGDRMDYLKKHKVKYASMSRRQINGKRKLLKSFRENDIKVYAYHVNFDKGKDEKYVFENEIGFVYGMYADKWIPNFGENP